MPIDYLANRNSAERGVSGIVNGRNPQDELNKTYGNIVDQRGRFLGQADQLIPTVTGGRGTSAINSNIIDRKTRMALNNQKRQMSMAKYNQVFNSAMDFASQYTQDRQAAEQYARQIADQTTQQSVAATEAEKGRQHKIQQNAMANEYAQQGVDLNNSSQPTADYKGALLRVLLGTGTAIGTYKYLNSKSTQPTPKVQTAGVGLGDYSPYDTATSARYGRTAGT